MLEQIQNKLNLSRRIKPPQEEVFSSEESEEEEEEEEEEEDKDFPALTDEVSFPTPLCLFYLFYNAPL